MTQYSTGKLCKRGHDSPRFIANRRCVQCHREYERAKHGRGTVRGRPRGTQEVSWDKRNPDKHRVYEQNRRVRLADRGELSPDIVEKLMVEQGGVCTYCPANLNIVPKSLDHKIPITRGGLNIDENAQLLCCPCNSRKHTKTHEEYLQLLMEIT